MKVARIFTIDHALATRLKDEANQSGLVNDLLLNHYRIEKEEKITPEIKKTMESLLEEKKKNDIISKKHKTEGEAKMQEWRDGKITEKQYWKWIDGR